MTQVLNGSAYPVPVDELLPAAHRFAQTIEAVPSRNRLMGEFRIGAPKAQTLLTALERAYAGVRPAPVLYPEPIGPDPAPEPVDEPSGQQPVPGVPVGPAGSVDPVPAAPASGTSGQVTVPGHPPASTRPDAVPAAPAEQPAPAAKPFPRWPLVILAAGAFVAVWSGWVGIGRLTGFGLVNLLPGFVDDGKWSTLDTAITLPMGVEAYGAYALAAFLSARIPTRARRFAGWSAALSLLVGAAGQASYHLLVSHPDWLTRAADGTLSAPTPIVVAVSALPVAVLGMGAALSHLMRSEDA